MSELLLHLAFPISMPSVITRKSMICEIGLTFQWFFNCIFLLLQTVRFYFKYNIVPTNITFITGHSKNKKTFKTNLSRSVIIGCCHKRAMSTYPSFPAGCNSSCVSINMDRCNCLHIHVGLCMSRLVIQIPPPPLYILYI